MSLFPHDAESLEGIAKRLCDMATQIREIAKDLNDNKIGAIAVNHEVRMRAGIGFIENWILDARRKTRDAKAKAKRAKLGASHSDSQ